MEEDEDGCWVDVDEDGCWMEEDEELKGTELPRWGSCSDYLTMEISI